MAPGSGDRCASATRKGGLSAEATTHGGMCRRARRRHAAAHCRRGCRPPPRRQRPRSTTRRTCTRWGARPTPFRWTTPCRVRACSTPTWPSGAKRRCRARIRASVSSTSRSRTNPVEIVDWHGVHKPRRAPPETRATLSSGATSSSAPGTRRRPHPRSAGATHSRPPTRRDTRRRARSAGTGPCSVNRQLRRSPSEGRRACTSSTSATRRALT